MKILLSLSLCLIVSSSFAQMDLFWENYSNYNPAMSGFEYQTHGSVNYSNYFRTGHSVPTSLTMNANTRLGEKHGVGLNYSGSFDLFNNTRILANYNYQFNLKDAGRLSVGLGAGFNRNIENTRYFSPNNMTTPDPFFNLQMNVGIAHSWKGLVSGISVHNKTWYRDEFSVETFELAPISLIFHTGYAIQLGEKVQLTPRALFGIENNNAFVNSNLTMTLYDNISIGVLYSLFDSNDLGFHAGYSLRNKYHVSYSYNASLRQKNLGYLARGRHQLTLGFTLK